MNNQNNPVEQGSATSVSVADLSLAEYRASREGKVTTAVAHPAAKAADEDAHAGDESLGESDAQGGAESTTDEAGGADDAAAGDKGKQAQGKKGGWQRQIEKLRRENEDLKRKVAAPAAGASAADPDPKAKPQQASSAQAASAEVSQSFEKPKPQMKDFDSIEAFADALTDYKSEKRDFENDQKALRERAEAEGKALLDGWNNRQTEARKTHSDYDEVLESVSDIALSPAHQRLFLDSDLGAELAYDLASNPDDLKKFAALDPLAAARFLGRREAAFEGSTAESGNTKTKVSNAPRPARSVSGGRSASTTLDVSKMGLAEYRAARESGKLR